jgi:hypothetical protein
MPLPIPSPESIPDCRKLRPHVRFASGQQDKLAELGHRSEAILVRCFEPLGRAPSGYVNPAGFIDSSRRMDARNRLFRAIFWQLASKEAERGRLQLELVR